MIKGLAHALRNLLKKDAHLVRTESEWASVFTVEGPQGDVRVLDVGGGYQSATYLGKRRFQPVFEYYRTFDAAFMHPHPMHRVLMIGGAGCAWPKHAATSHPGVVVDVVEEDSRIIDIAREYFFVGELEREGRLRLIAAEGRSYFESSKCSYDAILNDAFRGIMPARELATVEAAESIARRLNPGGLYLGNIVSESDGRDIGFLCDAAASLREVFPYVQVIPCPDAVYSDEDNFLVAASFDELDLPCALPFDEGFAGRPLHD